MMWIVEEECNPLNNTRKKSDLSEYHSPEKYMDLELDHESMSRTISINLLQGKVEILQFLLILFHRERE